VYYFDSADISSKYLRLSASQDDCATTEAYDVVVDDHIAESAVTIFSTGDVAGLAKIQWNAMDAWFEEDERIWIHPKDPYKVQVSSSPVNVFDANLLHPVTC